MMIGTWCGVRRNKLIGSLKNIEFFLACMLTISEDGTSFVGRICSIKILRSSRGVSTNKIIKNSLMNMISYPLPSYFQANMWSSMKSSRKPNLKVDAYGSWNLYLFPYSRPLNAKGEESSFSIVSVKSPGGSPSTRKIHQNPMSAKDIWWTLCSWEEGNSIWEFMPFAHLTTLSLSICIGQVLLDLLTIATTIVTLKTYVKFLWIS